MPTLWKGQSLGGARRSLAPVMTENERSAIDHRVPASRAWQGSEHDLQRSLVSELAFLTAAHPELERLFAVPNGGHRCKATAGKMRAEGQKKGVPDLCLPVPVAGKHGLYLELKKAGGTPSPEQWEWLLHLHRSGYAAYIANDAATARRLILSYLEP